MRKSRLLWFAAALGFMACDNGNVDDINTENMGAATAVKLEAEMEEADGLLDDISIYSGYFFGLKDDTLSGKGSHHGHSGFFNDCVDITVEEVDNTITTTITFNGTCEDANGNVITGTITKMETYTETSSENTVTVDGLSLNGYLINGTKTFSWTVSNDNGNPEMGGTVDLTIETEDGTITKTGNRTVEITEGADTDTWADNVKTITGSYTYTGIETSFSMEITTPLIKPSACRFIVSGIKTYTTSDGTTTLDYGDGTCDSYATQTLPDGTEEQITLGFRHH